MTILNMGSYISPATVYAVTIDESVTDPSLAVTYPVTAFGRKTVNADFTPAKNTDGVFDFGSWSGCDLLKGIKRMTAVMSGYDTTNTFTFTEHEMTDTITLEKYITTRFPTYWLKSEKVGTKITIALSPSQVDSTWTDYAGTFDGKRAGYFDMAEYWSTYSTRDSDNEYDRIYPYYQYYLKPAGYHYFGLQGKYRFTEQYFVHRQYVNILCMMMFKTTSLNDICGYSKRYAGVDTWKSYVDPFLLQSWDNEYGFSGNPSDRTDLSAVFGLSRWNDIYYTDQSSLSGGVYLNGVYFRTFVRVGVSPGYGNGSDEDIVVSYATTALQKVTKMYGTGAYPLLPVETEDYTGNTTIPNGWGSAMGNRGHLTGDGDGYASNAGVLPNGFGMTRSFAMALTRLVFIP